MLGKEEISFDKAEEIYENAFSPKQLLLSEKFNLQKHHIYLIFTLICFFLIYIFYK